MGRPGPELDLSWIDLEALESREDDPTTPVRREPISVRAYEASDLDPMPEASGGVLASVRSRTMTLRNITKAGKD